MRKPLSAATCHRGGEEDSLVLTNRQNKPEDRAASCRIEAEKGRQPAPGSHTWFALRGKRLNLNRLFISLTRDFAEGDNIDNLATDSQRSVLRREGLCLATEQLTLGLYAWRMDSPTAANRMGVEDKKKFRDRFSDQVTDTEFRGFSDQLLDIDDRKSHQLLKIKLSRFSVNGAFAPH